MSEDNNSFMGLVEVEDTSPASLEPFFNRESILIGPDWRWQVAQTEEYNERMNLPYIPNTDIYVMSARKLQRMMANRSTHLWFQNKWPSAYEVVTIAVDTKYKTMKTALEAAIIRYSGDTEKITKKVKWIRQDQLRLYKQLFFDLSGVTAAHDWMEDHVFMPALKMRSPGSQIALLTAYYSNVATDPTGRLRSKEEQGVLHTLMNNVRLRKVAEYVLGDTKIPIEMYAGMMETALKDMDQKLSVSKDEDKGTGLSKSIVDRLKDVTRRMNPDEVDSATEQSGGGLEIDTEMDFIRQRLSQISDKGDDK